MRINLTTPLSDDKEMQRRNEVILAAIERHTEERMSDDHTASSQTTQSDALLEGDAQTILYLLGVRHGREDERAKIAAETRQPTQSDAVVKLLETMRERCTHPCRSEKAELGCDCDAARQAAVMLRQPIQEQANV